MKILFVHNRYQYKGGEDTNLDMEIRVLEDNGHQTHVVLFDNDSLNGVYSKIKTGFRAFYNTASAKRLRAEVLAFRPDLIHVHNLFFQASPSILYTANKMKIPVVLTIHNYRFICSNALLLRENKVCELCIQQTLPLAGIRHRCYRSSVVESALVTAISGFYKMMRTLQQKTDTIIVPSGFLKYRLVNSSLRLDAENVKVKPNFVEDILPALNGREDFFLFVGRIATEKGIDVLLNYARNNPVVNLVIAGDGPQKEQMISALREMPSVKYVGHVGRDEVLDLMKCCKALIFPSIWYEGLPLTIIEALACGTPVIASRLGAMPEMIKDHYNGMLFTPGDEKDLDRAIRDFNMADYTTLQENARTSYETNYNKETHYKSIKAIYQEAINKNNERAH